MTNQQLSRRIRGTDELQPNRTYIMGILNVTPDSFSDGGRYHTLDAAVKRALEMVEEGADIIDIGGESTRPGHEPVPLEVEMKRVIPVVRAVREAVGERALISVDTYKAEVAREAILAGADWMNDIWGLKRDPKMAEYAAELGCPVVVMHNRQEAVYEDFMRDVIADLQESIAIAKAAGMRDEQIILDPGVGFAKSHEQNLMVMRELDQIVALGYPVLLATSRKRVIRHTLQLPVDDLVEGTAATVAIGIAKGCRIVRVHDVKPIKRTALMSDAIVYGGSVGIQ
ncbi:dihydropteroate synthase [Insulibacter thermoxylanivorax]|uniref:Dihydropteroate synthase n=1 Tax=Insulibacter thermoxylanivorax TaxID=2749268 RepID=A0A916VFL9_9BACL|nr:dihydropteroate synthase [Insulibacter thermoxylanivorax]GFR38437.1 dihydropteroate synthase [Insulibacter thermoxylanivorax]